MRNAASFRRKMSHQSKREHDRLVFLMLSAGVVALGIAILIPTLGGSR